MSESEKGKNFEGIRWEKELEDDSLAIVQEKIKNEFGTDFESLDYDLKGFSKQNSLPFYTDLEGEIEFNGEVYEIGIERNGGLNEIEFWTDNPQALETMESFLEEHSASNGGEAMIEAYKYKEVRDTQVLELLDAFEQRLDVQGPERRSGNGQPRIYPVRREHLEESDDHLHRDSENTEVIGNLEDEELELHNYSNSKDYVPGDAKFELKLQEEDMDIDVEGNITVKPEKREKGKYKVNLRAEDRASLQYLINVAEDVLN